MAAGPEKAVKRRVVEILKEYGAYYFYPFSMGYASTGVPDIVGCYQGVFFGIECKAGKNPTSALQRRNLEQITEAGGIALVINEGNILEVAKTLARIRDDRRSKVDDGSHPEDA